ncbi:bifunctional metallophosphatase/5'-nucleotidase [Prolixibacter denitrificans]|uniref:2',3'-cyclic-nucleotide 2'-phosphodiesterase (5'-nucleotidase family) n=1 Tax=Prolixibacter denitrificans TaxID=1541063 RepID=A0A2P8C7K8_9BACT|nr:bifunctional UDP-sugar hydrolase/5'-nucleotidase [Prolixibacter denitrificans]PSK80926.1 2',3'-cyclic-nucleotide 2'-phosphodiesterase (5'-nucleotidase family) [Prolixibacter denitrificans]GET22330.1 bifunctional UDP-sugar hydrolase/5'-nucleotidase [Prolixibacter denitrificans]
MRQLISILLLIILGITSKVKAQQVDLLYFTDAHRIFPVEDVPGGRGGVARLKTITDSIRQENQNTFLIHGGDLAGGVLFGGMYKGWPMIRAFNQIPLDLCNFGQHEFDFGSDHANSLIRRSTFQWFSSNLQSPSGKPFADVPRYVIHNFHGIRIAFIGLTDAMNTTLNDGGVVQENLTKATSEVLPEIKSQHPDWIIAVTQTDLETNRKLLNAFPQINFVFTEEEHEYNSNVFYLGKRPIIAPAGNMSSVAHVILRKTGRPSVEIIPLDSTVLPSPQLRKLEVFYRNDMNQKLSEPLARLEVPLSFREGITGESAAGNLVADAFRAAYHSDVALINGGGIRANVPAGTFTLKSARSLLPFGNKLCLVKITGNQLEKLIKANVNSKTGQLFQVFGIKYTYRLENDSLSVYRNGTPLPSSDSISVTMNNYILNRTPNRFRRIIGKNNPKAMLDYKALEHYALKNKVLHPQKEGRLTIISE